MKATDANEEQVYAFIISPASSGTSQFRQSVTLPTTVPNVV